MTGCGNCSSREVFVENVGAFVPGAPAEPRCRPCALEVA